MKHKLKTQLIGVLQAIGVLSYCTLIASFFYCMESAKPFDDAPDLLIMIFVLFLFVFSAGITGGMVFGYPVYLGLKGKIKQALTVLLYTVISALILGTGLIISLAIASQA